MTNMYVASPMYTFVDSSKGSMTNRAECAKEHIKNNLKVGVKTGVLAAGTVGTIALAKSNGKYATKIAESLGKLLGKGAVGRFFEKQLGLFNTSVMRGKAGLVLGAITVGVLGLAHILASGSYKQGQIDQKYTDAAKIESQTKNVVLA